MPVTWTILRKARRNFDFLSKLCQRAAAFQGTLTALQLTDGLTAEAKMPVKDTPLTRQPLAKITLCSNTFSDKFVLCIMEGMSIKKQGKLKGGWYSHFG